MIKKILLAAVLAVSLPPAFALDLYFTLSYQSYPLDRPDNQGRDVVFEKKPIKIAISENNDALYAASRSIKDAYIDYVKTTYPAYIERVLKSKYRDDLERHLEGNVFVAYFGTAAKAQADIEASIAHARKLGFSIVESKGFSYPK